MSLSEEPDYGEPTEREWMAIALHLWNDSQARSLFDGHNDFLRWLQSENEHLENQIPYDLIRAGRSGKVFDALQRMTRGTPS